MEIAALCQFVTNALRSADSFDLLVLKELVETLTGISIQSDLSDEQVRVGWVWDGRWGEQGPTVPKISSLCAHACMHAHTD